MKLLGQSHEYILNVADVISPFVESPPFFEQCHRSSAQFRERGKGLPRELSSGEGRRPRGRREGLSAKHLPLCYVRRLGWVGVSS